MILASDLELAGEPEQVLAREQAQERALVRAVEPELVRELAVGKGQALALERVLARVWDLELVEGLGQALVLVWAQALRPDHWPEAKRVV